MELFASFLDARPIEQTKISCTKKRYNEMSTSKD